MSDVFSFRLSDEFVNKYVGIEPPFGFKDAGLNSLGEITFIRTYSRVKEDGKKEREVIGLGSTEYQDTLKVNPLPEKKTNQVPPTTNVASDEVKAVEPLPTVNISEHKIISVDKKEYEAFKEKERLLKEKREKELLLLEQQQKAKEAEKSKKPKPEKREKKGK